MNRRPAKAPPLCLTGTEPPLVPTANSRLPCAIKGWLKYIFSWFLDLLAGYGYRPGRSLVAYLLLILGFAGAFYALGHLAWYEALVVSLTAFHGRGFFSQQYRPGDPQAMIAALEAVMGLLIEISLIATFTKRFFGN